MQNIAAEMDEIGPESGEIIDADDFMAGGDKMDGEVRSDETAGDDSLTINSSENQNSPFNIGRKVGQLEVFDIFFFL